MVKKTAYIPDRGDVVWLNFTPQAGREQAGMRPALVISPASYNRFGLALMCPITSKVKHHPFEVRIKSRKMDGVILVDHIKSQDWRARGVNYAESASAIIVEEVQNLAISLLTE